MRLIAVLVFLAFVFLGACGGGSDGADPEEVVADFYDRLSEIDLEGMQRLMCADVRPEFSTSGIIDLGPFIRRDARDALESLDVDVQEASAENAEAVVEVNGTVDAEDESTAVFANTFLEKENGDWCLASWDVLAPEGEDEPRGAAIEADPAPDLPGEFVDLQTIYSGTYGGDPSTAGHVTRDVDYESEQGLPPAGGPHWGSGGCTSNPADASPFCGPAPWGIYRDPWAAATMVHNMEHGGAVVWYNTTDQAIINELEDVIVDRLEAGDIIVLTPFPDMDEEHIALTTWGRRDLFPVSEYTPERIEDYLDAHVCRFNPEDLPDC